MLDYLGRGLARFLSKPIDTHGPGATCTPELLARALKKGDVLLVEGNTRISQAIKYLTQSSWSHSALYIGDAVDSDTNAAGARVFLEADINAGVRAVPLTAYSDLHTRICRPVGLTPEEIDILVENALARLGHTYDLKNISDLARYLLPPPPVPSRWRRRVLALGSGEPTQAICSSLIAEAFQSVSYPILPYVQVSKERGTLMERLSARHHSLFAPRDFDVSPYFDIVKPTLEHDFDPHALKWETTRPERET